VSVLDTAIDIAMRIARTDALIDAELAVLNRARAMGSYQLGEMRALNLAAAAIRDLREKNDDHQFSATEPTKESTT